MTTSPPRILRLRLHHLTFTIVYIRLQKAHDIFTSHH